MKKVFLDNLPKKGKQIDWKGSIGYKISFIYDDLNGEIELIDYCNREIIVKYNNNIKSIKTNHFSNCKIGILLGVKTHDNLYSINKYKNGLLLTNFIRINNEKGYSYICEKCKYEGEILEKRLSRGGGCPCCNGKIVVENINSLYHTDYWMVQLGVDEEWAKKNTKCSAKKALCKCPHCGKQFNKKCSDINTNKSISCNCMDGVSYPEKFIYFLLKEFNLDFTSQLNKSSFKWCGRYKYDFYIPSLNLIVETHGGQHYIENTNFKRTLKQEQENDNLKEELALASGIEYYIVLDCRKSELEWIKNSVLNSKLAELIDLSKIDWNKCEEFAIKSNKIKEVCDYWNYKKENETTSDLAKIFNVHNATISRYLKKGTILGWCNYNANEENIKIGKINGENSGKEISVFKDGVLVAKFKSQKELERNSLDIFGNFLDSSNFGYYIKNNKEYKGYKLL